jgi:hypothetical protein
MYFSSAIKERRAATTRAESNGKKERAVRKICRDLENAEKKWGGGCLQRRKKSLVALETIPILCKFLFFVKIEWDLWDGKILFGKTCFVRLYEI